MDKQNKPKVFKDKSIEYNYMMSDKIKQADQLAKVLGMRKFNGFTKVRELFNNHYCISQQINEDGKRVYYFHKDIEVIKTFIKKLPNHYLYEIIHTDYPKVYFDIDKIEMNEETYKSMVYNLVCKFNDDFDSNVDWRKTIDLVKRNDDDMIVSTHIIFPTHSIEKKILKWWVKKINENTNNYELDERVYSSNQAFCLTENCKYGKTETFTELYEDKDRKQDDYLVMTGADNCITEYKPYTDDMIVETERIENLKTLNKRDKNIVKVNGFNLVVKLLEHLPQDHKFYRSKFWNGFVATMKYVKVKEITEFLNNSVSRALKPNHYNIENNKEWFENIKDDDIEYKNIYNQLHKLNREYNLRFVWTGNSFYDTTELREWCSEMTGLSIDMINEKFNRTQKKCYDKPTKITFNPNTFLDIKRMYLIDKKDNSIKCYWNDYHNKRVIVEENTPFTIKSLDELKTLAISFTENDSKVYGLKMAWGMGKSHSIMTPLVGEIIKQNNNILVLTENNALNKDVVLNFEEDFDKELIWGHQDKEPITTDHKIFVCSMESLFKLKDVEFHTIILDEFETLLSHLESDTFKPHYDSADCLTDIKKHIINSRKLLCLDADLSIERFNILCNDCLINQTAIELYENQENKWRNHNIIVNVGERYESISRILNDLKNDKNISIAVMSKREAEILFKLLSDKFPNKNYLGVWRGCKKYKLNGEEERLLTTKEANNNMNTMIDDKKINVWIYSPSVLTGISYNKKNWFHKTYLLTSLTSCCARLGIQMLFRVRELIDKEIHISLVKLTPPIDKPTDKEIEELIIEKKLVSCATGMDMIFGAKCDILELYKNIKRENLKEIYLSNTQLGGDLGQEILRILTANHKIPLQFNTITKNQYDIMITKEEWGDTKDEVVKRNIEIMVETDYKTQYESNKQENNNIVDNNNFKSIQEVEKKKTLKKLGVRNSYYKDYGNGRVEFMDKIGREFGSNGMVDCYNDYDYIDLCDSKYMVRTDFSNFKTSPPNNNISIDPISYENFIHDCRTIYSGLMDRERVNHIDSINDFNINVETETSNTLDKRDEIQIYNNSLKWIIMKILPELFNKNNRLEFKRFTIKVGDFNKRLTEHKTEIETYWSKLMDLDKIKKRNSRLKIDNVKSQENIIYYVKSILKCIGVEIEAPKNKKRDNETYKIHYDSNYIYENTHHKTRPQDIRINENTLTINGNVKELLDKRNKPIKDIVSKNKTIKSSVKKMINYDSKDKLNEIEITKWKNGKSDRHTIYTTFKPKPFYQTPKLENTKEAIKSHYDTYFTQRPIYKEYYSKYFTRMKPLIELDEELKEKYHKNRYEKEKCKKCLIEDDLDDDLMMSSELCSALDRGISDEY